jgi:CheY-like chemotaxis protein
VTVPEAKKRILFVDDQQPVRLAATAVLRSRGYDVDDAAGSTQALDLIKKNTYDLILLDLVMPGASGWDVLQRVSARVGAPPIVLMSSDGESLGTGTITGRVVGYIKKPFAVGHLLETCNNAIQQETRSPAADRRHEPRRAFLVEGELLSPSGVGLARCDLIDMSRDGFQIRADLPLGVGDTVAFAFRVPGKAQNIPLRGRILWRDEDRAGVKVDPPTQAHFDILSILLAPPKS